MEASNVWYRMCLHQSSVGVLGRTVRLFAMQLVVYSAISIFADQEAKAFGVMSWVGNNIGYVCGNGNYYYYRKIM